MTKGAVIVESRDGNVEEIIHNHFKFLSDDWGLTFFGTKQNEERVRNYFPSVNFVVLPESVSNNLNALQYNNLLTSRYFWTYVPYEKVLIFQHDSKLLRAGIDGFLEWDFCGAPWGHFNMLGGNGGLSIRTKQKMLDVIDYVQFNFKAHGNEDVYFCKYLPFVNGSIAPRDIAMKFSVETIFYATPIGVHAADKYLSKKQLDSIYQNI